MFLLEWMYSNCRYELESVAAAGTVLGAAGKTDDHDDSASESNIIAFCAQEFLDVPKLTQCPSRFAQGEEKNPLSPSEPLPLSAPLHLSAPLPLSAPLSLRSLPVRAALRAALSLCAALHAALSRYAPPSAPPRRSLSPSRSLSPRRSPSAPSVRAALPPLSPGTCRPPRCSL